MGDENLSKQADEIEAMASIYGTDWIVEDAARRVYSITLWKEEAGLLETYIHLQVTLPPEYPSTAPPQYQLSAPWLRGQHRRELANELEEIYLQNMGEIILFLWVDKLQDFLQTVTDIGDVLQERSCSSQTGTGDQSTSSPQSSDIDTTLNSVDSDTDYWDESQGHLSNRGNPVDGGHAGNCEPAPITCPEIHHGDPVFDRKSTFVGHVASVYHIEQVEMVLDSLCENKKIASATHNIYAYRILGPKPSNVLHGFRDDGETAAGGRLLHLLEIVNAMNVMVVVTRWYGGIHLGPDRFKHINNCARVMLVQHNFIPVREDKRKPHSKKKKK